VPFLVPWHQVWHQDLVPSGAIIRWPRCPSGGSRRPSREAGSSMSAGDPGCWIRQSCWASWVSACRCEIGIRVVRSHRVGPWRSHSNHPDRERQRISTAPRPTPGSHHKAGQSRRGSAHGGPARGGVLVQHSCRERSGWNPQRFCHTRAPMRRHSSRVSTGPWSP
jgi:hypothetical protein